MTANAAINLNHTKEENKMFRKEAKNQLLYSIGKKPPTKSGNALVDSAKWAETTAENPQPLTLKLLNIYEVDEETPHLDFKLPVQLQKLCFDVFIFVLFFSF